MADPEPGEATAPPAAPDFSGNALRREPAIIEGTAHDLTPPDPIPPEPLHEAVDEPGEVAAQDAIAPSQEPPPEAISEAAADETAPASEIETPIAAEPAPAPRRRGVFVPALLSLIIGGAAGFADAYGLRLLDQSGTNIDTLGARRHRLGAAEPARQHNKSGENRDEADDDVQRGEGRKRQAESHRGSS